MLDRNNLKGALDAKKTILNAEQAEERAEVRTRSGTSHKDFLEEEISTGPKKVRERRRSIYGMDECKEFDIRS